MMTRLLMILSAVFLLLLGVLTLFFPQEVLERHGTVPDAPTVLLIQMMGALYLGFAMLDWMARGVLVGGVYARPVALGNFTHFAIVAVSLAREAAQHGVWQLATSAAVFGLFAVGFGIVLFRPPAE